MSQYFSLLLVFSPTFLKIWPVLHPVSRKFNLVHDERYHETQLNSYLPLDQTLLFLPTIPQFSTNSISILGKIGLFLEFCQTYFFNRYQSSTSTEGFLFILITWKISQSTLPSSIPSLRPTSPSPFFVAVYLIWTSSFPLERFHQPTYCQNVLKISSHCSPIGCN